jgi:hypothetical protein
MSAPTVSVTETRPTVTVDDSGRTLVVPQTSVEVVSAGTMGPASLAVGSVITQAGDVAIHGPSGVTAAPIESLTWRSVKDPRYGAVGDGVTDDTAAIQAAIDAAEAVRGIILFPSGEYKITAALVVDTQGVMLRGASRNGTLGSAEIGAALKQTTTTADALAIKADAITVEDIQVYGPGTGAGTGRGIVVDTGVSGPPTQSRVMLRRVWARNFPGSGVVGLKQENITLDTVWATGNGGIGILLDSSGGSNPTTPTLINCRAADNLGTHQIHIKDAISPVLINCQALNGTAANANLRLQSVSAPTVIGGDYEGGGASGIQVSGTAGGIQGANCISVTTGISCTTWTDGVIQGARFPSSVTTSIATDSGTRVFIGLNQDASTGGMSPHADSEVSLAFRRQTRTYAAALTPNPTLGEYVEIAALTGNISIANPTKLAKGLRLTFRFLQDGTGGRTVTFGSAFKHGWADTGNTANKQSTISFAFDGTNWIQVGGQSPYV